MNRISVLLISTALLTQPGAASAAESATDQRSAALVEEILVVGEPNSRIYELAETLDVTPDSAALLKRAVGANVVSNGPLTGMAQYRGMSRMRISSRINGQMISPGGPNWMDPPLSYAPAAHLDTLEVHRGIASVAAGMETIGGVINATTWQGEFSDGDPRLQGRVRAGGHSVNNASLLSAALVGATRAHRFKLSGLSEQAGDAEFGNGSISPTEYQRERFDLGYGYRRGAHSLQLDYGHNETGDTGTPALPMDIEYIDSDLFGFGYDFAGEAWRLDGNAWYSEIDHGMSNYHLRGAPMAGSMYRRNVTDVRNYGFSLAATAGLWRFGIDGHDERHNSDIENPNNPMFFVTNFNDAQRQLLGVYLERDFSIADAWGLELGGRYNRVKSNAGEVDGTPAVVGMPPAVALRDAFNDADRNRTDNNVDLVAKLRYVASPSLSYYLGAGRKTRAPSYQERYLWLPLQATAGLADGRTYTGNTALKSETAAEIELGFDFENARFRLAPRAFYRDVQDYIQGTVSTNQAAIMFVRMMNTMNGTNSPDPLEFNNVDAELYGVDLDWGVQLAQRWTLEGVLNYVRGKIKNDNLYRVAPFNGFVALGYGTSNWRVSAESFFASRQEQVSAFNGEPETAGYAVFNLNGFWEISDAIRLSAGVENVADKVYSDHLGGVNRVRDNPDIAPGERLPGYGRNFFARFDLTF